LKSISKGRVPLLTGGVSLEVRVGSYRSSCSMDLCPVVLCWRAGLCFAELAPDGGPLYSEMGVKNDKYGITESLDNIAEEKFIM